MILMCFMVCESSVLSQMVIVGNLRFSLMGFLIWWRLNWKVLILMCFTVGESCVLSQMIIVGNLRFSLMGFLIW